MCIWYWLKKLVFLLFSLFLLLCMGLIALLDIIHKSHCIISPFSFIYSTFFFFCWFSKVFSGFYSRTNPSRYSREPRRGSLSRKFAASTRTRNRDHLLKQPEPLPLRPTFLGLFTVFSAKSFQFQLNNLFLNRY